MRRRDFIALCSTAAAAWPIASRAQQPAMPVIGFLSSRAPGESANVVATFRQGLHEAGFVEGQNVLIAFRWAEGRYDQLSALAAELVDLRVAVLFAAGGPPSALAAKAATQTIPVVFSAVTDPVRLGLVASLNKPAGNVTGMSLLTSETFAKSTQLLKELLPTASVIAYLVNPSSPTAELYAKEASTAASALGITLPVLKARTDDELDEAFASLPKIGATGLVVPAEPFFDSHREHIVALATSYALRDSGNRQSARICRGGWPDQLWSKPTGFLPASGHLCRPHSQRRQASRSPRHATDEVRPGDQSEDSQSPWPHHTGGHSVHRRRGD
jgi:putative ABC transport system substrate-binding protein